MPGALVLLTGRSFSGKSTAAAVLATRLGAVVVALDAINEERGLHGGEGIPVEEWSRTNDLARDRTRLLLEAGRRVIVDDTASPRFLRDAWRELAASAGAAFALVHVDTDVATVRRRLERNRSAPQRRDVTDAVMEAHLAAYQPPAHDEPHLRVVDDASLEGVADRLVARPGLAPRGPERVDHVVELVPSDPSWAARFTAIRPVLAAILPGAEVEHIGSTSVPGLPSKDTIDIAVGVPDVRAALTDAVLGALRTEGFVLLPASFAEDDDHAFLHRVVDGHRTHHLHVMRSGAEPMTGHLAFRDLLRGDPEVRARYAAAKRELADRYGQQRDEYVIRKGRVVEALLREARGGSVRTDP